MGIRPKVVGICDIDQGRLAAEAEAAAVRVGLHRLVKFAGAFVRQFHVCLSLEGQPNRLSKNGATGRLVERPASISAVSRASTGANV